MKQQLHAPAYIPPKKPEDILRSLVWLQGLEEEAIAYVTSNAEMLSYDYGDVIVKQGEVCDGIYLIISGMVKVLHLKSNCKYLSGCVIISRTNILLFVIQF